MQIDIYVYAFIILLFLLYDVKKIKIALPKTVKWYQYILYSTMMMLIIEGSTWVFDGREGVVARYLVCGSNSLLFLFILVPLSLWLTYLDECIVLNEPVQRKKCKVYVAVNLIVVSIVLINLFTGILFTVNAENQYIRGNAVYLIMFMNIALFIGYLFSIIKYRKFINGRIYQVILALGFLPLCGGILQMIFYGVPLIWPMMALVAFAAHILIEREETNRDILTGLFSRPQLEARVLYKISRQQPFSLIMIDLDKFKRINDTFGHEEGDDVLRIIASLLEKSIKQVDSAYRYGGDEFMIIVESEYPEVGAKVEVRLKENLRRFNESKQKPYTLSFSSGMQFYDGLHKESLYELFTAADENMYKDKKCETINGGTE